MKIPSIRHSSFVFSSFRIFVTLLLATAPGCAWLSPPEKLEEPVGLLAILPMARGELKGATIPKASLAPKAERAVTGQIYSVLAESSHWRFVPDLTVTDAMLKVDSRASLPVQAVQLGKAVNADGVLCGTVWRYSERVGSDFGVTQAAIVSFDLQLVSVQTGKVLWQGEFDKEQEPLTSNLLDWWMFWDTGPKWLTAAELTHVGLEELLEGLDAQMH